MMAEDDDEEELFGTTAPSTSPANSRGARPTQPPASDFQRRPQRQQGGALEMAKPSHPIQQTSPGQTGPSTEPSRTDPETTAATTEAPDPDAEVCSGRPFDSFMQVKNGSVFAFRGESHAVASSAVSRG